jgi:lysozyme
MKRVGAAGPVVQGIDVSHYQGKCDFKYLKGRGVEYVIAKCTEYGLDNQYANDRASAKANGVIFGGYDYFHSSRDPIAQAKFFMEMAKPVKGDLRPMIDVETLDALPARNLVSALQKWLDYVEAIIGVEPLLYGGPYFLDALGLPASFKRYPLVIAHYGTDKPLIPGPWKSWAMHQYTDKGNLPGIPGGREDLDRFNGTMEQLLKYCL